MFRQAHSRNLIYGRLAKYCVDANACYAVFNKILQDAVTAQLRNDPMKVLIYLEILLEVFPLKCSFLSLDSVFKFIKIGSICLLYTSRCV